MGRSVSVCVIGNLMVVPDRNPWELLVALVQVYISPIGSNTLSVVVQSVDLSIWQWDAPKRISPAIFAVCILVYIITEMHNIINRILPYCIAIGVEETKSCVNISAYPLMFAHVVYNCIGAYDSYCMSKRRS